MIKPAVRRVLAFLRLWIATVPYLVLMILVIVVAWLDLCFRAITGEFFLPFETFGRYIINLGKSLEEFVEKPKK